MSKNSSNLLGFAALFQSLNPFPSYIHLRFRPSAVRSGCKGMKFIFQNASKKNYFFYLVPRAGLEPARPQRTQDFKSCVSTDFTIWARERETRLELATPTLARLCSTN